MLLELSLEADWLLVELLLGSSLGILCDPVSPPYPLLELVAEFCRLSMDPGCALDRLLTLSDLFMKALCTNPPMPFVGDVGRSVAFASRACDDDMLGVRSRPDCSPSVVEIVRSDMGDASACASSAATSDFRSGLLLVEVRVFEKALSRMEPVREVVSDFTLSDGAGLASLAGSTEASRDMPGRPRLPDTMLSPAVTSSLFFLYAALPTPLSAVCLNQVGSRAPNEAAI